MTQPGAASEQEMLTRLRTAEHERDAALMVQAELTKRLAKVEQENLDLKRGRWPLYVAALVLLALLAAVS